MSSFDDVRPELFAKLAFIHVPSQMRLVLWAPVFFALGIGLYFQLRFEPDARMGGIAFGFGLSLFIFSHFKKYNAVFYQWFYIFSLCVFLVIFGFVTAQIRTHLVYTPMLTKSLGPVDVEGTIQRIEPKPDGKSHRLVLRDLEIERLSDADTPRKVRLVVRNMDQQIKPGDRVQLLAELNPPSPPVSPGAFDFQRYAFFQGLGAVGFAYRPPQVITSEKRTAGLLFETIRQSLINRVKAQVSEAQAGIVITLLTGQKGAITEEDQQAMRDAGLAHLLAISGMHVGMIAGLIFFASRLAMAAFPRFALYFPIKKIAAVIALFGALFYTLLAGASVPTQRALIMTGLALIAIIFDRSPLSLRLVAIAAFAVLLVAPESLMNVSFQMSFSAVIALISFYELVRHRWGRLYSNPGITKRIGLYIGGIVATTVVAEVAIAPLALFHFQHHAVYGIIGNMVAIPLMAFWVMPFLLLSLLLMPLGLDGLALKAAAFGVEWILGIAKWTAGLDGAVFSPPAYDPAALLWFVSAGIVLCLGGGWIRALCVPFLAVGLVLAMNTSYPDVIISSKVKLIGVRDDHENLILSNGVTEKYASENWLRMNGQKDRLILPREGAFHSGEEQTQTQAFAHCDNEGCRLERKGQKIALSYTEKAWQEDCAWADIVVSSVPVSRSCNALIIIDRFSVWREDAYQIFLANDAIDAIKVESVLQRRGHRPWAASPAY